MLSTETNGVCFSRRPEGFCNNRLMELRQLTRLRDALDSPYAVPWDFDGFYRCLDRLRKGVRHGDSSCGQLSWEEDMLRLIGWRFDSRIMPAWQENARQVLYYATFARSRYGDLYRLACGTRRNRNRQARFDNQAEEIVRKLESYRQDSLETWLEVRACLDMSDEVRQKAKEWRIHNASDVNAPPDLIAPPGGGQTWEGIEGAVSILNYMMALYEMTNGIWESAVWDIERVRSYACTDKRWALGSLKELKSAYMEELWRRYGEILMNAFDR